jgi:NAD(P)-dependent dehydrogenase (short-subunit alcohol dehydrogenase family)
MTKVVAITGASNGMGFAAAELFAKKDGLSMVVRDVLRKFLFLKIFMP